MPIFSCQLDSAFCSCPLRSAGEDKHGTDLGSMDWPPFWTGSMDHLHGQSPWAPVMDRAYLIWVVVAFKEGCTHPSQGLS